MKLRLLLLSFLFSSVFNVLLAETPAYIQTRDGVIVFTDPAFTGTSHAVKLEVVSDNIIRVIACPGKRYYLPKAWSRFILKEQIWPGNLSSSGDQLTFKNKVPLLPLFISKQGRFHFSDAKGKKILNEKPIAGRSFQPAVFDGKRYYNLTQTFQTTSDDAWYGLASTRMVL